MKNLDKLYIKALSVTKNKITPESINDLLIKELNEIPLSQEESKALSNYHKFRNELLASATDDNDFSNKIQKLRVIANFVNWQEFLQ